MKFLITLLTIGFVYCDKLPNSAPYPPSGWRPQGVTLTLPSEYGLPQQQESNVEITKENVQFVGQVSGQISETTTYPSNEYLPPGNDETSDIPSNSDDTLRVQGLPKGSTPGSSNGQYNQLNSGEFLPFHVHNNQFRHEQQQQQLQQRRQQQPQGFGQLRQVQRQRTNSRLLAQSKPNNGQFIPFQQQQTFQQQQQQQYQPQYQPQYQTPQTVLNEYLPPPTQQYPVPSQPGLETETNDEDDDTEVQDPAVSVANSVNNGQYYILGEDNTLQKVVYMTSQTEDDRLINGYTAQLKYAPVEPIRDPVYSFDAQGHLVKIFNKK